MVSDGTWWSLARYQLNTVQLWKDVETGNTWRNVCWFCPKRRVVDEFGKANKELVSDIVRMFLMPTDETYDMARIRNEIGIERQVGPGLFDNLTKDEIVYQDQWIY